MSNTHTHLSSAREHEEEAVNQRCKEIKLCSQSQKPEPEWTRAIEDLDENMKNSQFKNQKSRTMTAKVLSQPNSVVANGEQNGAQKVNTRTIAESNGNLKRN
ncbi:hypothetical protein ACFX13_009930 [Malus domestica]